MEELILVRSRLKGELEKQKFIKEQWKKNYEEQKLMSTLEQIRYVEGIIEGIEKSIKEITRFIEQ